MVTTPPNLDGDLLVDAWKAVVANGSAGRLAKISVSGHQMERRRGSTDFYVTPFERRQ